MFDSTVLLAALIFTSFVIVILAIVAGRMAKTIKSCKKQLERISVNNDTSSGRVEVLEAKIKTLEAALKKALEDKQG